MTGSEVLIAAASLIAGIAGLLPPAARRRTCAVAAGAALALGVLVATLDRLRLPVAGIAVALLAAGLAAFSLESRVARVLAVVSSVLSTALAVVALWALPRVTFPEPTGPAQVGTSRFEWTDEGRNELATSNQDDSRTVVVQVWYPADPRPHDSRALHLGRTPREARLAADGIAAAYGLPSLLLRELVHARTRSFLDAPPEQGGKPWPVVLFSPGLAGYRAQNTGLAEELASHGYFVVALDHPYDSATVVLDDGRAIATNVRGTGDREADNRATDLLADVRAKDLRFTISQLEAMGSGDLRSRFGGRIDTRAIAAVGHSVGGAAAIQAGQQDRRIDAIVNLDGFPRNVGSRRFPQPVLAIVAGRGTGDEQNDIDYRRTLTTVLRKSDGGGLCLTVAGASHLTFTDAPRILPPLPSLIGSGGRKHGRDTTSRATLAFLDRELRGKPDDITGPLRALGDLADVCDG